MDKEILKEIQELKTLFAKLIGTADQSTSERFSEDALNKAAKDFHEMTIERGDWVKDDHISRYIKPVPWNPGKFIREQFAFTNWFKKGHDYYYSKRDLIALSKELDSRNIDIKRYEELLVHKAAFDRSIAAQKNPKKKGKPFKIPKDLRNITTTEIPKPDPELARQDLAKLKQEFKTGKLENYIDIYNKGTHAMVKHIYFFEKYLESGLKRRCRKWCDDFNYANNALKLITGKKEKFTVTNPDLIQL